MKLLTCLGALLPVLMFAGVINASTVTLDMTVNDGTSPVTIGVGETVQVKIFGTVTNNTYTPPTGGSINLGLFGYGMNLLTSGGYLNPVNGYDDMAGTWDHQWDVAWQVGAFAVRARGNTDNAGNDDDVLGLGDGLTTFTLDSATRSIGVARTLLASGYFVGVAPGTTLITIDSAQANVVWYASGYKAVAADSIVPLSDVQVTVVPEPGTVLLLGAGLIGMLRRRFRRTAA